MSVKQAIDLVNTIYGVLKEVQIYDNQIYDTGVTENQWKNSNRAKTTIIHVISMSISIYM